MGICRLPQSTLNHIVPVCLEGCLRSKIVPGFQLSQSTQGCQCITVYPGMPMPWISNGYPWICRLPQSTLNHIVPVCLEGCLRSKIVPGFQLSQSTQGCQCHEDPMGMHCPSPFHHCPRTLSQSCLEWVCKSSPFHTVPRCPSLP